MAEQISQISKYVRVKLKNWNIFLDKNFISEKYQGLLRTVLVKVTESGSQDISLVLDGSW